MDALVQAQEGMASALKQWQADGQKLLKSATLMGIETEPYTAAFSAITTKVPVRATGGGSTTRARSRSRASAGSGGNGSARRGRTAAVTEEQFLGWLRETGGATQGEIAEHFGITPTSTSRYVRKWGDLLAKDGRKWTVLSETLEPIAV